jgi:CheY-like chemotaxis protein
VAVSDEKEVMARILGVDDSIESIQQLKSLLTSFGHQFYYIVQPGFLFQRLEEESFDLILLDLNMPDINGIELLRQIKEHKKYSEIPVVMITADDDVKTLQKCFNIGASDFINKPINDVVLKTRINAVLSIQEKIEEILRNQEKINQQELEIERQKTLQYQLRSLSTNMNPHFIFNSLNSVQYYILDNQIDSALEFISEFSSLMRISLYNSGRETVPLTDEIEFLEAYLRIESKRFAGKLEYEVSTCDKLKQEDYRIPPMLVQPYVENAIIHGIVNRNGNGKVTVSFCLEDKVIVCEVVDDGIGREAAGRIKAKMGSSNNHRSMGMGITQARLNLLNHLEKDAFSVSVMDLKNKDQAKGTKVKITFPVDL